MRPLALAVLLMCAFGCGRSGDGGFGSTNEGIQNNGASANGCEVPSSQGWTDPHDALAHAAQTGDFCSFGGAGFAGGRGASCLNNHLIVETQSGADISFCGFGDGGVWPPTPVLTSSGCIESCQNSGGAIISCPTSPVRAPSRQLSFSWSLNAPSDCGLLFGSCPQVGDSCTGSTVCSGLWAPNAQNSLDTAMWCDHGSLQMVMTD